MPRPGTRRRSAGNGGRGTGTVSLSDVIGNQSLADDVVIDIGGQSFTLGDLRDMHEETGGASTEDIDRRERDLATSQTELIAAQEEMARMFQHLSTITGRTPDQLLKEGLGDLESLPARRRGRGSEQDDDQDDGDAGNGNRGRRGRRLDRDSAGRYASAASGLDEDDPILQPFIARIEKLQNTDIKGLKDEIGNLRKALGIALKVNLDEYYDRVYQAYKWPGDEVLKKHKFARPDLAATLKYAETNGLKDTHGRWNVSKALTELTQEVRHKIDIEAAEERGKKLANDEQRMAGVTPPGASRGRHDIQPSFKRKDGQTKDFGDVLVDAANDNDLWNSAIQSLGGGGSQAA